jgi:threonine dehydrogenase-like Zn-dependent dehydrogenase
MRALWIEDGRARLRDDLPEPAPAPGEVLVRVVRAGICGTDLELLRGYAGFAGVPGHEFVGVVERGPSALLGRRVVGEINAACCECRACRDGLHNHCPARTVLGIVGRPGAFAERLALPARNLHPVPDDLPTDAAVFTEPLAAALEILEQVDVGPDTRALVVGDGRLGQLVARVLRGTGCEVTVLGRHPEKLALLEAEGIATARSGDGAPGDFVLAVECSGRAEGFEVARRALRARGTLVLKSTYAGAPRLDLTPVVVDELTLVGSRCGPFAPALALLARGEVRLESLIHARYPLGRAEEAMQHAGRPGVLKVLLEIAPEEGS